MSERIQYTLAEVAEMTGLPLRALADDCRAGRIAHIHKYRKRFMTRPQIDAMLRNATVEAAKPFRAQTVTDTEALDRARAARRTGRAA
ncbi:MAG TPA: hypothetical protein VHA75_09900 [Rugosimonospora sp.]|nr:hypothetical protein [Rugosimonospora sp.]